MNSRERVQAAFQQQSTDRVPVMHLGFTSAIASALLGRDAYVGGGIQQWREVSALWQGAAAHQEFVERSFQDAVDLACLCEHDIVRVRYWRYNHRPTQRIDAHTFLFEEGSEENWKVLRYSPESEECTIAAYRPRAPLALAEQVAAEEAAAAAYRPDAQTFDLELRAQRLLGHERVIRVNAVGLGIPTTTEWLEATLLYPDLVARYLDAQVVRAIRNVEFLAPHGLRYFFGGGDLAANTGPMYSPKVFRTLMLPRLQQISDACHRVGGVHLFGSDGCLWPVAADLFAAAGVDGYHEIDRRAGMDLGRLRAAFPKLTLIGNISSHTVHVGSRKEVIDETLACLEEARRSYGIIVGVSNYFVLGTPLANVHAVIDTLHRYR
jgi:hypothetical protein